MHRLIDHLNRFLEQQVEVTTIDLEPYLNTLELNHIQMLLITKTCRCTKFKMSILRTDYLTTLEINSYIKTNESLGEIMYIKNTS